MEIVVTSWNCDRVSVPLDENTVQILGLALSLRSSVLVDFTLDTTLVTEQGLGIVQNILQKMRLQRHRMVRVPFLPHERNLIGEILQAIQ